MPSKSSRSVFEQAIEHAPGEGAVAASPWSARLTTFLPDGLPALRTRGAEILVWMLHEYFRGHVPKMGWLFEFSKGQRLSAGAAPQK